MEVASTSQPAPRNAGSADFEWIRDRRDLARARIFQMALSCVEVGNSHWPRTSSSLVEHPRKMRFVSGAMRFVAELKRELPPAFGHLQQGNVAPVDFAQAAIGPGMAVFSKSSAVLESRRKTG